LPTKAAIRDASDLNLHSQIRLQLVPDVGENYRTCIIYCYNLGQIMYTNKKSINEHFVIV